MKEKIKYNGNMKEQELLELKQEIDLAIQTVSTLKGQKKVLLDQLKELWNCETLEDAKIKLEQTEKELETVNKKIKKGLKEVESKYNVE